MTTQTLLALAEIRAMAVDGRARAIRMAARVSLTEVAESAGVAPATVARWEAGDRRPRGEPALRYRQVLYELAKREQGGAA